MQKLLDRMTIKFYKDVYACLIGPLWAGGMGLGGLMEANIMWRNLQRRVVESDQFYCRFI